MTAKTLRAKKRGAAGWCEAHGIGPGARIEVKIAADWVPVTVMALGHCAILARRKGYAEFAYHEPTKMRLPQFSAVVCFERHPGGIVAPADGVAVFNDMASRDAFVAEFPEGRRVCEP